MHPLIPFLQSQSEAGLNRLYDRPSACLSIFRLLEPLEQQIITSLLWLEETVPAEFLLSWIKPMKEAHRKWDTAVDALATLHIVPNPANTNSFTLNSHFKASLRTALTGGGSHDSFGVPCSSKDKDKEKEGSKRTPVTIDFLDKYALERWEDILHFMVSSGGDKKPQPGVLYLLKSGGLMQPHDPTRENSPLAISSRGFQFLLQPAHDQLWDLLSESLKQIQDPLRGMDVIEVLGLILMLATMELGQEYSTERLSETERVMLEDLRDYGLIWQRNGKSKRFHPTRLATTLTSSLPPLLVTQSSKSTSDPTDNSAPPGSAPDEQGFIIIETNYRLYAYTDNALQVSVLALFCSLKSRFPNLVVASLTRESVKRAFDKRITADQIINYLTSHAHPQMRKNNPIISSTIQDQIRIWENERNRVKTVAGNLYGEFATYEDYNKVVSYAHELGVVLWEDSETMLFFAHEGGHEGIKAFVERERNIYQ